MTKYFSLSLKALLFNPALIFWAILFVEYWVLMWAYVFGANVPAYEEVVKDYTSMAYGSLTIISLSAVATGIADALIHSSKSIKFVTKYTKLSPSKFLAENLASSLIALLIVSAIMFCSMIGVFWHKFGMLVLPENPLGLLTATFLTAIFLYAFSAFLSLLVVVLRAPKSASFVTFIPLMLSFLSYSSLWIDLKIFAYISPFNCISALFYHYFSGKQPVTGGFFTTSGKELMDITLTACSMIAWTVTMFILVVTLLRNMRGIGIEEIRLV
ncbi:MAG: hypothetical protein ACPLVJ_00995 [Candidatus Bathyarchaeales archaeon]